MRTAAAAVLSAAMLAGCAGVDRTAPPAASISSAKPVGVVAACIVREMDARSIDRTGIGKTITHRIDTRQPGKLLEVQPQQVITEGAEIYFITVAATPTGSVIGLHGLRGAIPVILSAAQSCI